MIDRVDGNAREETKSIPARVREEVLERDKGICRMCGMHAENPALHHVRYKSEGGTNTADNLITVHWMYEPRCHERIHSNKKVWQPLGLAVIATPGVTMLQLRRWQLTKRGRR